MAKALRNRFLCADDADRPDPVGEKDTLNYLHILGHGTGRSANAV